MRQSKVVTKVSAAAFLSISSSVKVVTSRSGEGVKVLKVFKEARGKQPEGKTTTSQCQQGQRKNRGRAPGSPPIRAKKSRQHDFLRESKDCLFIIHIIDHSIGSILSPSDRIRVEPGGVHKNQGVRGRDCNFSRRRNEMPTRLVSI